MKKIIKTTIIMVVIMIMLLSNVYSFNVEDLNGNGATNKHIKEVGGNFLFVLSIIASAISIIALIFLGIKYMLGSVEERAQYKKTLFPYVLGAVLVFGATTISGIVYNLFN